MEDQSPLLKRPDYLVCTCMGVMYSDICRSIEKGARSFQDLQDEWFVGTGCSSCVVEIEEILVEQLSKKE